MSGTLIFDPLVPWVIVIAIAVLAALGILLAVWRRLQGWWLRGLAGAILILALANPSVQQEDRAPLSDIIMLVVDESASQRIADRPSQSAEA